jgi:hypothetical protein
MSWDEYNVEKVCPCGAGTYMVTRQENDWGKSHEWLKMNCAQCQDKYITFTLSYLDLGAPGGTSSLPLWVLKADKQAVDNLERQIERESESMLRTAQSRYSQRWLARFAGKTKNDIWAQLKSINHSHVPSLGTFYNHTKNESAESYLREWFRPERIKAILAFLDITDAEMAEADKRLKDLAEECEAMKQKMVRAGVHA